MALRLWLPLDGTTENRGASGTTMTGSPVSWGTGKTGQAAVFNNNAANLVYSTTTDYNYTVEDFSWCMWVKKDWSAHTNAAMFAFTVGRADAGGFGYGMNTSFSSGVVLRFGSAAYTITGIPDNEWHHIAFTRKGSKICTYRDGTLVEEATFSGTLPTYSDGNGVGVGCFHYTGNIYPLIGSVSDFRIYDHALSAREVHEISNALILYFKLAGPTVDALPNMITWNRNDWTVTSKYAHTSASTDGIVAHTGTLTTVTAGKTYYIQVKSSGIPGTHTAGSAVTNNFTLFLYIRNIGTTKSVGNYDAAQNLNKNNIYVNDQENGLYVWKWTAPANAQDIVVRTNSYSNGSTSVTLYFWDLKIEEGAYTSYVPSVNMPQYTALGFNSTTVYDESGWIHNGTRSSTATGYVPGSPRNNAAWAFSGDQYIFPIPDPIKSTTEEFTISLWFNASERSTNQALWCGRTTAGKGVMVNLTTTGFIVDDDNRTSFAYSVELNRWYHLAVTWKRSGLKITYLDGVAISSVSASSTLTKSNSYASIGRLNTADTLSTLSDNNELKGMLSDVRIYGTSLSADDVLRLYRSGTSFDNLGGIHSCSLDETKGKATVLANGTVGAETLSERGGNICAYTGQSKGYIVSTTVASYTPTASTANSCMRGYYFERIEGVYRYHVSLVLTWSGYTNISTEQTSFNAWFQGVNVKLDGTEVWESTDPVNNALNGFSWPGTLARNAASGSKQYEADFTVDSTWMSTYKGGFVGLRTDYSNGTGKWTISKVKIYPAVDYCDGKVSLDEDGGVHGSSINEVI